jgi:hypothetical protein
MRVTRRRFLAAAASTAASLANPRRSFCLVYVNSFNEWHEGHQFEPVKDYADLSPSERVVGCHNASNGGIRLSDLSCSLASVVQSPKVAAGRTLQLAIGLARW